jgi:hypothetical protein
MTLEEEIMRTLIVRKYAILDHEFFCGAAPRVICPRAAEHFAAGEKGYVHYLEMRTHEK